MSQTSHHDDEFELYDLTVVVEKIEGHCTCNMAEGDCFYMHGGKISLPEGRDFCLYALQAVIPLLPAKQRRNHPADWMETDARVVCPDPACRLIMRIDRVSSRILRHDDVSPIAWEEVKRRRSAQRSGAATKANIESTKDTKQHKETQRNRKI